MCEEHAYPPTSGVRLSKLRIYTFLSNKGGCNACVLLCMPTRKRKSPIRIAPHVPMAAISLAANYSFSKTKG
jgi:hypothetical protein